MCVLEIAGHKVTNGAISERKLERPFCCGISSVCGVLDVSGPVQPQGGHVSVCLQSDDSCISLNLVKSGH